jgi:hypothetical protein
LAVLPDGEEVLDDEPAVLDEAEDSDDEEDDDEDDDSEPFFDARLSVR